ncbi:MAG TPA: UDP-N-acetylmuramoyl-L-alanyl-D-glutamate--2,6-diaminopimelate ligase [Candidatus Dormibacteraeota bacterium]|jgi:UDP-N-acetylmuramoyl-L-alanyl-D-glutamate--2,6-diaminopimelate ligase|nr:UDP-N-acetylmuramoyl-L-alanyl-D-glutamate--2,6-diaminopimelate ligase [Candidatus Dormibacteraeota bacterium]
MRFSELLADLALRGIRARRLTPAELDPDVPDLTQDTRQVPRGGLFVAISGSHVDGHDLVPDAVAAGAASLFVERQVPVAAGIAAAQVESSREALAWAAAALSGHPTEEMSMVGVTGTDGKSTTCVLTVEALRGCGVAAGGMNSLEFRCLDEVERNNTYQTTLDAPLIQARMRRLVDAGVDTAVLETTSHGIDQQRVAGVAYDVAAYTNLSHEHLDYHGSLERYRETKLQLAELARQSPRKPGVSKSIVYNADEPQWAELATAPADQRLTYGIEAPADLRAVDIVASIEGIRFSAIAGDQRVDVRLPLTGRFNVANALCALGICLALGHPLEPAAAGLARTKGLRGRMQVLDAGQPYAIVIDYAHTPDGLEKVLGELRPLTRGRLLTAFGAPGDRDATKRPLMGSAVAALADEFVITSDDPRQESAADICAAIASGATAAGRTQGKDFEIIVDRGQAIREIIRRARPGDTVLLAGKGHEDRLLVGPDSLPWDEAAEARAAVQEAGTGA